MKIGIDYIGVGVGAVICSDGKILLQKRSQVVRNERGKWIIPGGVIEFGETLHQSLKREVKEEIGLEIEIIEPLAIKDHIILEDKQHWVTTSFICRIKKGIPKNLEPEKCEEIRWVTLSEAKKLDLASITAHDIKSLEKKFPKGFPKNL